MVFAALLDASPALLALDARRHAILMHGREAEAATLFARAGWTCHACGLQLPGLLEIDHLDRHAPDAPLARLAPICPFCHDLRHPLWAAARRRFTPVFAPDIEQRDLVRLAWVAAVQRHGDAETGIEAAEIFADDVEARHRLARKRLGGGSAEAVFEAFLAIRDAEGEARARSIAERLDAEIRFVPEAALRETPALRAWRLRGFVDVPIVEQTRDGPVPADEDACRRLAEIGRAALA